jgi:two-component system, chemotaxis family, protein-glutamate methylesterase/glutaminase
MLDKGSIGEPGDRLFECVAIGASAGGLQALRTLLSGLPAAFPIPIVIVQHVGPRGDFYLSEVLDRATAIAVKEAEDKELMHSQTAYVAPAGYHLLVERDGTLSLSVDEKVNFCRPAIDPLFESAADAFGQGLIGIVLTGANADGAKGLVRIKEKGGYAIVQDPRSAESPCMPQAAIEAVRVDKVLDLDDVSSFLAGLVKGFRHETSTDR